MPANKRFNLGPVALTTVYTTNILNPPTAAGGVGAGASGNYVLIYQIKVVNKTAVAATFRLFKGATGGNVAGTEIEVDKTVPANDEVNLYFQAGLRFDVGDFLVGGAGTTLALVVTANGEIGVAG